MKEKPKTLKISQDDIDVVKAENEILRKDIKLLEEDNDIFKEQAYNYERKLFASELENDRMRELSIPALIISFIISYAACFAAMFSLCEIASLESKVATATIVWFSAVIVYNLVWSSKFRDLT